MYWKSYLALSTSYDHLLYRTTTFYSNLKKGGNFIMQNSMISKDDLDWLRQALDQVYKDTKDIREKHKEECKRRIVAIRKYQTSSHFRSLTTTIRDLERITGPALAPYLNDFGWYGRNRLEDLLLSIGYSLDWFDPEAGPSDSPGHENMLLLSALYYKLLEVSRIYRGQDF